jgi:hypothetical protein
MSRAAALSLRVRVAPGSTFKASLNDPAGEGAGTSVVVSPRGIAIVRADGQELGAVQGLMLEGVVDLMLVSEGGAARVYIDGELVLEVASGLAKEKGPVVFEAKGKRVEIESARVRAVE